MDNTAQIMAAMRIADLPRKKSIGLAVVLSVLFGWLGALYGNWKWALSGVALTFVALVIVSGNPDATAFITVANWIAAMIVGWQGAKQHNDNIYEKRRKLESVVGYTAPTLD